MAELREGDGAIVRVGDLAARIVGPTTIAGDLRAKLTALEAEHSVGLQDMVARLTAGQDERSDGLRDLAAKVSGCSVGDLRAKVGDVAGLGVLQGDVGAALEAEFRALNRPHPDEQAMLERVRRAMESYHRRMQLPESNLEALHEMMRTATPRVPHWMELTTGGEN